MLFVSCYRTLPMSFQIFSMVEFMDGDNTKIALFGRELNGTPHTIIVHSIPYNLYLAVSHEDVDVSRVRNALETHLRQQAYTCRSTQCRCGWDYAKYGVHREPCAKVRPQCSLYVTGATIVRSRGFLFYEAEDRPFVKFTLKHPYTTKSAVKFLSKQKGVAPLYAGVFGVRSSGIESFIQEKKLAGYESVYIPSTTEVHFDDLHRVSSQPDENAPVCVMAIHVEVITKQYHEGEMNAAVHPVGVIACTRDTIVRTFILHSSTVDVPIQGEFNKEEDMLMAFCMYIIDTDPDVFLGFGWNPLCYLLRRAKKLGLTKFPFFSRLPNHPVLMDIFDCPGRVFIDLQPLCEPFKLSRSRLDDVAVHFGLNPLEPCPDAHYWFHGYMETREALVMRCQRYNELVSEIALCKMDVVCNHMARCRVFRVEARDEIGRGNMYALRMMVEDAMKEEYLMPYRENGQLHPAQAAISGYSELWGSVQKGIQLEGGYVMEPEPGLHKAPVVTLDFNSLYPNEAITYNLCHSTQLFTRQPGCIETPMGFYYVPQSTKEGLLPRIWRTLLQCRRDTMVTLTRTKGSTLSGVLQARQLAFKVAANALYGIQSVANGPLCSYAIASSITAYGRRDIKQTKEDVEIGFPQYQPKVIYIDTDSLFVRLDGVLPPEGAWKVGHDIEAWINQRAQGTMSIKCEDVSQPTLMVTKKKYAKVKEGRLELTGLGNRSTNQFSNRLIHRVLEMEMIQSCTPMEIGEYVNSQIVLLLEGRVSKEELLQTVSLNKYPNPASREPHVTAALQLITAGLKCKVGDRIGFYQCIPPGERVIAAELVEERTLDYNMYADQVHKSLKNTVSWFTGVSSSHVPTKRTKGVSCILDIKSLF